jgi:hypothetical protein
MLKAIRNAEEAQSSLQLSVVLCPLLVDSFELVDFLLGLGELLSILGRSLAHSGGKPIGCGTDGGIERRVEGKDCLSRRRRDRRVVVLGEVDEAGDGPVVAVRVLLVVSDNGEWEGGSCWRRRDFCEGDAVTLFGRGGDALHVRRRAVAFIAGAGGVGHLAVVWAEVVVAETAVLETVSVRVVAEWTEANVGISTGYLARAKLNKFVRRVDGEVAEERAERETRNSLRCQSCCPGIDGWGFCAAVTVAVGVGAAAAVAALPLSDVLWWASTRSQVGCGE